MNIKLPRLVKKKTPGPACPECGGETEFQPALKRLVCTSCGLSFTREELEEMREKLRKQISYYDDRKREDYRHNARKRRLKEYEKWWASEHGDE